MHPAPIGMADRTQKKSAKHNLNFIGAPSLVSIAYWQRGTSMRQYIGAQMPPRPQATTIGAPIYPAPIVLAHQNRNTLQVHRGC
jgi:hypothetical protein